MSGIVNSNYNWFVNGSGNYYGNYFNLSGVPISGLVMGDYFFDDGKDYDLGIDGKESSVKITQDRETHD